MRKILYLIVVSLFILNIGYVKAKVVKYKQYFSYFDNKNIQLMGKIETDDDITLENRTYLMSSDFSGGEEISVSSRYKKKGPTVIPKYTPLEQKLINTFGFKKLDFFVNEGYIYIGGSNYRFETIDKTYLRLRMFYNRIITKNKKELKTNLKHKRIIRITSKKAQKIKLKLYSISPDYYTGPINREAVSTKGYDFVKNDRNMLTLYDTTQEYYNVIGYVDAQEVVDKEKFEKGEFHFRNDITATKKYELIKFNKRTKNRDWISKSVIPYYEITVDVEKGVSDLYLGYETYQFPNRAMQIQ